LKFEYQSNCFNIGICSNFVSFVYTCSLNIVSLKRINVKKKLFIEVFLFVQRNSRYFFFTFSLILCLFSKFSTFNGILIMKNQYSFYGLVRSWFCFMWELFFSTPSSPISHICIRITVINRRFTKVTLCSIWKNTVSHRDTKHTPNGSNIIYYITKLKLLTTKTMLFYNQKFKHT
jgi:hypothetical protein